MNYLLGDFKKEINVFLHIFVRRRNMPSSAIVRQQTPALLCIREYRLLRDNGFILARLCYRILYGHRQEFQEVNAVREMIMDPLENEDGLYRRSAPMGR